MSKNDEFTTLSSIEKCPICNGNLEKGYFTAPRGIYWGTEKHELGAMIIDWMMPRISSFFTLDNAPALRCVRCGIAILDCRGIGKTPRSFLKKCVRCGEEIPIAAEDCYHCGAEQPKKE